MDGTGKTGKESIGWEMKHFTPMFLRDKKKRLIIDT